MNTNKIAKVWSVLSLILLGGLIWALVSRTIVVGPGTVVPNVTPPEVEQRIDSLRVEVIKRDQQITTLQKRYENLKIEDNELRKKLEDAKIKLDSLVDFSGDAAELLKQLTIIAETPWD